MLAYYGTFITEHIAEKPDGGIICTRVPIARTGEMQYLARELQLDGDPDRIVAVVREADDVFDPAALASFEGAHVTDNHPPENVTAENFSAYSRGHVQNIRREGDYVVGDIHINDKLLASEVLHRVKRQISCGYECVYEPLPDGGGAVEWEDINGRPDLSNVSSMTVIQTSLLHDLWDENNQQTVTIPGVLEDENQQLIIPVPKKNSEDIIVNPVSAV